MTVGAQQLHELDAGNEHVHREQAVVLRNDDQRVTRPDHTGGEQRSGLGDGQRLGRAGEIAQAGDDEALGANGGEG